MEQYLKATKLLDYNSKEIKTLISSRGWRTFDNYNKIGEIYRFVQNEILLGFNKADLLTGSEVLADGIGQCNTKATLLMTLLRAVDIPCRLHGTKVSKQFQQGVTTGLISKFAPKKIVHTWVEVFYENRWICLEGVIADNKYIKALQNKFPDIKGEFHRYAVSVSDFSNLRVDWNGEDTTVQREAVVEDFGVFDSPDDFFAAHSQTIRGIKRFLYESYGRKVMTNNIAKIRKNGV